MASKRIIRESALYDKRMLQNIQSALASCIDKKGGAVYKEHMKRLDQLIAFDFTQDEGKNRKALASHLSRFGVKLKNPNG